MSDSWFDIALGDVFNLDNSRLGRRDAEPEVLSLSKYDGLVRASDYFDKRIASQQLDTYKLVPPEAWAYSTIHIDEGSIARNSLSFGGVISPMYTTMIWRSEVCDPAFFELLLRTPKMLSIYRDHARGTVNRRRSLNFETFASLRVRVPRLAKQRQIVDLIAAVDETIDTADGHKRILTKLQDSLADYLIWSNSSPRLPLKNLCVPRGLIGGPFGSSLVRSDYVLKGVPVIRGANLSTGSRFVGGDFAYVNEDKARVLQRNLARPGDVIATQRGTIGQVVLVPDKPFKTYVVSQSQMRLRVDPEIVLPEYVYFALATNRIRSELGGRTIATANPHINLGIFGETAISVPSLEEQQRIVSLLLAIDAAIEVAGSATAARASTRSALLDDLLSGDHEIPAAYDELLSA
jgi:hypothetical protein